MQFVQGRPGGKAGKFSQPHLMKESLERFAF